MFWMRGPGARWAPGVAACAALYLPNPARGPSAVSAVRPAVAANRRNARACPRAPVDTAAIDSKGNPPAMSQPAEGTAMNTSRLSIQSTLATAAAAIVLTAAQFSGIDALATPRAAQAVASPAYLPLVVVTASRTAGEDATTMATVSLPRVVVSGHAERSTAQVRADGRAS
jgi:hypothetical protein